MKGNTRKKQPLIDILQIDCSKIKLDDELKIYYDSFPWDISIKKIAAAKIKGNRLKKKTYLQIMRETKKQETDFFC